MRWWPVVFLVACDGGGGGDAGTCVSDSYWNGGNEESPEMHPGMNCIECHTSEGEGPQYLAAGTLFTNYDEPDDCNGVSGATVELTGDDGTVLTATSNGAGNFFFTGTLVTPYTARVLVDGVEVNKMVGAQSDTNCANCHTAEGANAAPGRIIVP